MKTFTEFSTLVLRRAAAAKAASASLEGDALAEAMAAALGVATDRVARLLEALRIVGDNLDAVRLVRVYQGRDWAARCGLARRVPLRARPRRRSVARRRWWRP
ncbi:MAG: hypothetical protein IPI49_23740 [Myxococcales bacterium]|nr:hypothetical protein [Myxococcales bacterium]